MDYSERGAFENRHKISTPTRGEDERWAFRSSRILSWIGRVLAILSPVVGFILMVTSDDGSVYDETGFPPRLIVGAYLFVVGTLSGLFMVMISSFVRAHLDSQTQLINLIKDMKDPKE